LIRSRQTVELVAGAGIAAVMTIGYIIYVGRVVGPAEYSDFSAALSAIYFVGLTMSPLTPTISRLTARYQARGASAAAARLRYEALRRVAVVAGALTVAAAIAAPLFASALRFRSATPLVLAFLAVLLYAIVSVDRGVTQGLLLFRLYNTNIVVEAAVRLAAAAIFFLVMPTASAALLAYALALGVAELFMAVRLRRREGASNDVAAVDWTDVKRLAVPIMILMFAIATFQNLDMLAVKRWFSAADAGSYGAATAIARGVGVVFAPFYVVAGPLLTSLHEGGKPVFAATLRLASSFAAAVLLPLLILALAPRFLVGTLYGDEFSRASAVIAPLAGVGIITYIGLMLGQALLTLHDFRFLGGYILSAALQAAGLAMFHHSYGEVLRVLYVSQGVALLSVTFFFCAAWWRQRRALPC
jgi:O-antigen/teichoic acid export membrane protein